MVQNKYEKSVGKIKKFKKNNRLLGNSFKILSYKDDVFEVIFVDGDLVGKKHKVAVDKVKI